VQREERHHVEPDALLDAREAVDRAGLGDLEHRQVAARARPAVVLEAALDHALHVEAPARELGSEGERLEGERELEGPALGIDRALPLPDRVPGLVLFLAVGTDQGVQLGSGGVHLEQVPVAMVLERVEDDQHAVVRVEIRVALHLRGDDRCGLAVEAADREIEVRLVVQRADLGLLGRRLTLARIDLDEGVARYRGSPDRVVQLAVDDRRGFRPPDDERGSRRGLGSLGDTRTREYCAGTTPEHREAKRRRSTEPHAVPRARGEAPESIDRSVPSGRVASSYV
jgi:hypothetical protein